MGKAKTCLKTQKIGIKQETANRTEWDAIRAVLFRSASDDSGTSSRARAGRLDRKTARNGAVYVYSVRPMLYSVS